MIFQLKLDGTMANVASEPIYQGGNNINKLYCIAPYKSPVGLVATFTLPSGTTSAPYPMAFKGELANVFPATTLNNLPQAYTNNWSVYELLLPYAVTMEAGTLKCSILATTNLTIVGTQISYDTRINSYNVQLTVSESALLEPPAEWDDDQWAELVALYTQYITSLQSRATALETKVGSATLDTTAQNLSSAVNELHGEINGLDNRLDTAEDDIDALQTKVGSATLQTINPDLSGAMNEVYNRTLMNATNIGNPRLLNTTDKSSLVNAVNETNTKATTNKTNIGTMLNLKTTNKDTLVKAVNDVYDIAQSKSKSLGFNNIQTVVASLNAENQTAYKVGDNLYIRTQGVSDLWVYSVESTNVPYTYVSDAQFENDLTDEVAVQIGYYKVARLETVEGVDTIAWNNIEVETSDWVSDTSKTNYFYKAYVELGDFVDTDTVPTVAFNTTDAISGNFAPIAVAVAGGVFIWAKTIPSGTITIESIVTVKTLSRTVNNDSVIGIYDLVIRTQTDFDDLVNMLSTNTLPSTIHSIAFVGSGKRMPVSDIDEYYDFVHSGNGLVFPATVREIKGFANPVIYNSAFTGNDSIMAEFNHEFGTIYLPPQLWGTSIEGITLNINPASSLEVAMGFYKCVNIKNCSVLYNLEGTSHAVPSVIGFAGCFPVDNCCCWLNGGAITTSDVEMIGFNTCNNVTNCWCAITSNGASSTSMGFDECEYISNCNVGGISGHTTYCYNDIKYASNCGVGTSVTATAKWAGTNSHISSDTCDGYQA